LPAVSHKMHADVRIAADRGKFKGVPFEKLDLALLFTRGVIESYKLKAEIDKGQIAGQGSVDLRDLQHIVFKLAPKVSKLPLSVISPALGTGKLPLTGPLTLTGQMRGTVSSHGEMTGNLDGKLDISLGPGRLSDVGKLGEFVAKLSSVAHIRNIFSGRLLQDISGQGLPFKTLTGQTSFDNSTINVSNFHFISDVMKLEGQCIVDLDKEDLDMEAQLVPLVTIDAALNYVPLVGDALKDVSRVRIRVDGSLQDPRIHTEEVREMGNSIEAEIEEIKTTIEDVGKGLKK